MKIISVIIPTHNPDAGRIHQMLSGLKKQSLPFNEWELIIVDNNSAYDVSSLLDLSWHPFAEVVKESTQGLTYARLKGFERSKTDLIVMVDDDNILSPDYLSEIVKIFKTHRDLGAIGGKSFPIFEEKAPDWIKEFQENLAVRNLGEQIIINEWEYVYPEAAPIGAGMGLRKLALSAYIHCHESSSNLISDRRGNSLSSGGDNDIILEILKSGWKIGYFPSLSLLHIIPSQRTQKTYLARLLNNSNKSWIEVLDKHQINPWSKITKYSARLRKIKAWFTYRAWLGPVNYIKWRGACGIFDGRAHQVNR